VDIVLGVSMTPSAVRMVLVEGEKADGPSLDHDVFDIAVTGAAATFAAPRQVVDAILGTRESALEGGHRLTSIGVAWTDHAAAGRLRALLRSHRIDDVVLVSELHAAGALAQAIGQTVGYERIALLFVECDTATLAVVRAADGAVVRVTSRSLQVQDAAAELRAMVAGLDAGTEPAQAVYVVGSGIDATTLEAEIASATTLPVHAPQDGDLALARGAALASATAPRFEASTVWLASTEDTAAGSTELAAAGYMAPLGYSAVADDDDEDLVAWDSYDDDPEPQTDQAEPGGNSFVLLGSALSTLFVIGVAALAVTLAVVIRPTADSRPAPGGNPVVSSAPAAAPAQAGDVAPPPAPETIQAPIPVVQQAPRTVFVAPQAPQAPQPAPAPAPAPPAAPEPAPAPAAPPPAPEPAPAPAQVSAPAPAPAPPPAPAPAPAAPPPAPILVPVPIVIPPIFQPPAAVTRIPSSTATYPTSPTYPTAPSTPPPARTPYQTSTPPMTTYPEYPTYPTTVAPTTVAPTTVAPSAGTSSVGGSGGSSSGAGGSSGGDSGSSRRSQNPLWPLWPFG